MFIFKLKYSVVDATPPPPAVEPEPPAPDALPTLSSDNDAELQKYLDRSYWEQRGTEAQKAPEVAGVPVVQNGLLAVIKTVFLIDYSYREY